MRQPGRSGSASSAITVTPDLASARTIASPWAQRPTTTTGGGLVMRVSDFNVNVCGSG